MTTVNPPSIPCRREIAKTEINHGFLGEAAFPQNTMRADPVFAKLEFFFYFRGRVWAGGPPRLGCRR